MTEKSTSTDALIWEKKIYAREQLIFHFWEKLVKYKMLISKRIDSVLAITFALIYLICTYVYCQVYLPQIYCKQKCIVEFQNAFFFTISKMMFSFILRPYPLRRSISSDGINKIAEGKALV